MPRDTGIAARLRAAGLNVHEVAGWQDRGSADFNPRGSVDHHTAGPRVGNAPSLNICINGRTGLPGPLCHVLIGRDNTCFVIAAGRANHAGTGGWRGLSGNSSVYGIERENVGTTAEPWRADQTDVAARAHAALVRGRAGADMVCGHREWAPTRKVDAHSVNYAAFRQTVKDYLSKQGGTVPEPDPPVQEDEMYIIVKGDDGSPEVYSLHGNSKTHFANQTHVDRFVWSIETIAYAAGQPRQVLHGGKNPDGITGVKPLSFPADFLRGVPTVGKTS